MNDWLNEWRVQHSPFDGSVHFKWTLAPWLPQPSLTAPVLLCCIPSASRGVCGCVVVYRRYPSRWMMSVSPGKFTTLVIQVQSPNTTPGRGPALRDAPAPSELRRVRTRRGLARLGGVWGLIVDHSARSPGRRFFLRETPGCRRRRGLAAATAGRGLRWEEAAEAEGHTRLLRCTPEKVSAKLRAAAVAAAQERRTWGAGSGDTEVWASGRRARPRAAEVGGGEEKVGAPLSGPPPHVDLPRRRRRRRRRPRRCPPCAPLRCGRCWHCGCAARPRRVVSIRLRGAVPGAPAHAPPARLATWGDHSHPSVLHLARRPGSAVGVQWGHLVPKVWTASDRSLRAPPPPRPSPLQLPSAFGSHTRLLGRREAGQQASEAPFLGALEFGDLGNFAHLAPCFLGSGESRGRAAWDNHRWPRTTDGLSGGMPDSGVEGAGAGRPNPAACTFTARLSNAEGRPTMWMGGFGLDGDRLLRRARVLTLWVPRFPKNPMCKVWLESLKGGGRSSRKTGVAACWATWFKNLYCCYSFRGAELGRSFRVCVQPQECGVTITNSSNLAAAKAVLLAWLGVGQGRVKKSGYVNSKWCLPELLFGWISATVFLNTVGSRKGNPVVSYPSHPLS